MHSYLGEADTMFEWMKKNINEEQDERPAKIIHKICVRRGSDCYDVGRHFVLKLSIYCHFKQRVSVYLEMADQMSQRVVNSFDVVRQSPFTS